MASDLEISRNTTSGFFVADLRDFTAQQLLDWALPGDKYHRVRFGSNAVVLKPPSWNPPTSGEISTANAEWEAFSRPIRVRIRLFQEATIKRKLNLVEVYCLYCSFIPQVSDSFIKAINTSNFRYLGQTWSQAKTNFSNDALWAQFWPSNSMNNVIFGYESDAA